MLTPQEAISYLLEYGFTQQEIAEKADVKQATISRLRCCPKRLTTYPVADKLRAAVDAVKANKDLEHV